jgi:peptidoglycan/LPS O-acetylase OafA/YrhL
MSLRFTALDSWRGICALIVALFHFPVLGFVKAVPLVSHGYLFVDFFFVLSGFVIATVYEEKLQQQDEGWRFVVRRFGRLWPLHVFMLLVFIGASVVKGDINADERHSVGAIWTNLFLVHGWGGHEDLTWNGPSWSVSVEALLYFIFMCLAAFKSLRWRTFFFSVLVGVGLLGLAFEAPNGMASTFDFGIYRGLAGFFAGALLTRAPAANLGTVGEIAVVALGGAFVWFGHLTLLSPLVFGVVVYVFAHSNGLLSRTLNTRPALLLGEWSYSIYMVHAAFVAALWALAGPLGLREAKAGLLATSSAHEAVLALGYLTAIILASAVTFHLVEKPGREFFNGLSRFRTGPTGPSATQRP